MTNNITQLQFLRGTTAQNDAYTGAPGEITIDTELNQIRVHDGVTAGGHVVTGGGGGISSITVGTGLTSSVNPITTSGTITLSQFITASLYGTSSWAVSASRASTTDAVDVLPGGSTTGLGIYSGSFYGTASAALTASYALNAGAGSGFPFSGSAVITGSLLISGSGLIVSGSTTVTNGVTGSLLGTASKAVVAERVDVLTGGSTTGNGVYSGSFNGTFVGDGSGLTNLSLPPSTGSTIYIEDDGAGAFVSSRLNFGTFISAVNSTGTASINVNLPTGTVSSSAQINTGSFSGSFAGTLSGTASYAPRALSASRADSAEKVDVLTGGSTTGNGIYSGSFFGTASYANTASYALNSATGVGFPFSGSAVITGSLLISGSGIYLSGSGLTGSILGTSSRAVTASNAVTASYVLPTGLPVGTLSSSLQLNSLTAPITGSFSGSLTGTLVGTSSWATTASRAITASFAITSSYAVSSSYALSASYAVSSSRTVSASRADSSEKVDVLTGGSTTGNGIYSGSFSGSLTGIALTASYALNAGGALAGFPYTGTAIITGSLIISSSGLYLSGSGVTGSLLGTSSWAVTSSHALKVAPNSVALGTDTTGNYVGRVVSISGQAITISGSAGEGAEFAIGLDTGSTHFLDGVKAELNTETVVSSSAQVKNLLPAGTLSSSLQLNSLTGPITGSFTGSLRGALIGTSSWATTASNAVTSSYVLPSGLPAGTISSSLQLNSLTGPITGSFTGSLRGALIGTSSWAVTASNAITASYAVTSSYAVTASYSVSSSYAVTSSYAVSASYSVSASRADSSERVDVLSGGSTTGNGIYSGSFSGSLTGIATTASYALNAGGAVAGFPYTGNAVITGSLVISSSGLYLIGSGATGSLLGTSSWAITASHAIKVAPNSVTLGTDTVGNYTARIVQGQGTNVSGSAGEGVDYAVNIDTGSTHFLDGVKAKLNTETVVSSSTQVKNLLPAGTLSSSLQLNSLTGPITGSFTGSLVGSLTGTGSWAVSSSRAITASNAVTASHALSVAPNSVALGTDTTGNYTARVVSGLGTSVSGSAGEGVDFGVNIDTGSAHFTGGVVKALPAGTVSSSTQQVVSTFTNGVNNYIVTATGTSGINGEANLTFDGSQLLVVGQTRVDTVGATLILNDVSSGTDAATSNFISFQRGGVEKAWVGFGDGAGGLVRLQNTIGNVRIGASGEVQLWSANSQTMTLDTSNRVGIGNTAPDVKLSVIGVNGLPASSGTTPNGVVRIKGTTNSAMFIGNDGSSPFSAWLQVQDITGLGTYYPLSLNPNGGNVGIGTSSPAQKLHVEGNINLPQGNYITWANGDSQISSISGYHLVFSTYNGSSLTEKVRVESGGNVGIGTTSPQAKLHVQGAVSASSAMYATDFILT